MFPLGCAPSPGAYDVKTSEVLKGPVSFRKSQRFKTPKGNGSKNRIMVFDLVSFKIMNNYLNLKML